MLIRRLAQSSTTSRELGDPLLVRSVGGAVPTRDMAMRGPIAVPEPCRPLPATFRGIARRARRGLRDGGCLAMAAIARAIGVAEEPQPETQP